MEFFNGYKTYIGVIGYFGLQALQVLAPALCAGSWDETLMALFAGLAGIGAAHKLAKVEG